MELILTKLIETKKDLEKYIKSEREFLELNFPDYKTFIYKINRRTKQPEFYFFISFSGTHKNSEMTGLDDLCEIQEVNGLPTPGKPLNSKKKNQIKSICDLIFRYERRLKDIHTKILKLKLGENFWDKRKKVH